MRKIGRVLLRLAGVALALAGLVMTYNLIADSGGRVGPIAVRTGLLPLAGPWLLAVGVLMALVTRVSRRRASARLASPAEAASPHIADARHWHLKRVV